MLEVTIKPYVKRPRSRQDDAVLDVPSLEFCFDVACWVPERTSQIILPANKRKGLHCLFDLAASTTWAFAYTCIRFCQNIFKIPSLRIIVTREVYFEEKAVLATQLCSTQVVKSSQHTSVNCAPFTARTPEGQVVSSTRSSPSRLPK